MSQTVPVFTGVVVNPFPRYTQCVTAADYNSQSQYLQAFLAALLSGGIAAAIVYASGPAPWCYALATEVGLMAGGLAYCNWWLNDRLICLPQDVNATTGPAVDVCAVGMFVSQDQDDPSAWPFDLPDLDTDWTMDIVLNGTEPGQPVDILIGETEAIRNLSLGFENGGQGQTGSYVLQGVYDGNDDLEENTNGGTTITSPVLHCEVEGAGVHDYQNWLQGLFWLTVGGLIAQEAFAALPAVSAAISELIALLAFLLSLLGFYASEFDQANKPTGPGNTQIAFNPPGSSTGPAATVVCVVGTWVYDTAHDGWNEIHPVKSIQALGSTSPAVGGYYAWDPNWAMQCGMLNQAGSVGTLSNQSLATNGWIIHPLVDGCGSYPLAPPAPNIQ